METDGTATRKSTWNIGIKSNTLFPSDTIPSKLPYKLLIELQPTWFKVHSIVSSSYM